MSTLDLTSGINSYIFAFTIIQLELFLQICEYTFPYFGVAWLKLECADKNVVNLGFLIFIHTLIFDKA